MKAKNGLVYKSNYERAAAFYETTCVPAVEGDVVKEETYKLMTSIHQVFGEQADSLGFKPESDVFFQPGEPQKGREADVKTIRTPFAKMEEFMGQLYEFSKQAVVTEAGLTLSADAFTPKKMFKSVLAAASVPVITKGNVEIACGKKCAEGLKALAKTAEEKGINKDGTENQSKVIFYFSRCVFDDSYDWLKNSFDYMLDADGRIVELCEKLEKLGFAREILVDGRYVSLNYIKEYSKKPEILKKAWADKFHLGIEISYEDLCIMPAVLHLRTVCFVEVLRKADELSDLAKKLIQDKVKKCNGCRYCVQTDKTGTRPLAAVEVDGVPKCPYFPSFSLRWNKVDDALMKQVVAFLEEDKYAES